MTDTDDVSDRAEQIASSVRGSEEGSEPTEESDQDGQPRREFLSNSAIAGGALLALGGGTGMALAQEDDDDEGEGPPEEGMPEDEATFDDVAGTDIDVLNYALSLERLEAAFYAEATETFDEETFIESDALSAFPEEMRIITWEHVQIVSEHEASHAEVLTQAVTLLGGEPPEEASYDFGFESVEEFLGIAATLENTGVAAYAGAAPYIESPDLLATALSIHSVEARHAAFFNVLTGQTPFPNAYDEAASQQEVMDAVSEYMNGEMPGEGPPDETDTPDGTDGNGTDSTDGTDTPDGTDGTTTDAPNGTDGTTTDAPNGTDGTTTDAPNGTDGTTTDAPNGTDTPN